MSEKRKRQWNGLVFLLMLGGFGCQEDQIASYRVPKEQTRAQANLGQEPKRLLAAILPHGERTWFLKLLGPQAIVTNHEADFFQLVDSLKLTDNQEKPLSWRLPAGWSEEPGNGQRYATMRLDAEQPALEVSVVALGREAGSLEANINRWRGQMGLPPMSADDLTRVIKEREIHGVKAILVDMAGEVGRQPSSMPPLATRSAFSGDVKAENKAGRLEYKKPSAWTEDPKPRSPRIASFTLTEGGQTAEITVTAFPGNVGGLANNILRWRQQLGLGPADEEEMLRDVKSLEVAGSRGHYLNLIGAETRDGVRQRMLVVMLPRGEESWFFKMVGPGDLVQRRQSVFETFLKSIRFKEGPGGS